MQPIRTLIGVGVLLLATACGGGQQDTTTSDASTSCEAGSGKITIATGNTAGVYYALGGGVATVISDNTDLEATAIETGASVANIEKLVAGEVDIAFAQGDVAADAVTGTGGFTEKQPIQALVRLYRNDSQVVVRADSGILSVADMAGKRISLGSPKSGTEYTAKRMLDVAGLDPAIDLIAEHFDLTTSVEAVKAGELDGFFWAGGLPTPGVADLFAAMGDQVRFLDVSPLLPAMRNISAQYESATVPQDVYGTPAALPTISTSNLLLVRDDFADGNACAITTLIFGKQAELMEVHPAAAGISRTIAAKTDPVPLAPGAQAALQNLGIS